MYLALMSLAVLALMMLPGKTFLLQIVTGNLRTYRDSTLAKLDPVRDQVGLLRHAAAALLPLLAGGTGL